MTPPDKPKRQKPTAINRPDPEFDRLLGMLYGEPRTGKSLFCASACLHPDIHPVYIDMGNSFNTVLYEDAYRYYLDNGMAFRVDSLEALDEIYEWLAPPEPQYPDNQNALQELGLNLIVLDEADQLHEKLMHDRLKFVNNEKEHRSLWKPAQDDFGVVRMQMLYIFRQFLKLNCHILVTSWAEVKEDDKTKKKLIMPTLPGKLAREISGKFDTLGYTEKITDIKGDTTYKITFSADARLISGIRGPARAERVGDLINADFPTFFNLWRNPNA